MAAAVVVGENISLQQIHLIMSVAKCGSLPPIWLDPGCQNVRIGLVIVRILGVERCGNARQNEKGACVFVVKCAQLNFNFFQIRNN